MKKETYTVLSRKSFFNIHSSIFNRFFLSLSLILASHLSYSQKLTFCESVDSSGNAKNASSSFVMSVKGGSVNILVTLPHGVNSDFITYDIFRLDEEKKEIFENSIKQQTLPEYTWLRKEITLRKSGIYNVYVYDDKDELLCVGKLAIRTE